MEKLIKKFSSGKDTRADSIAMITYSHFSVVIGPPVQGSMHSHNYIH